MVGISPRVVLATLVALAVMVGLLQLAAFQSDFDVSERGLALWTLVFTILVATWIEADSRYRPGVYRPFELGWLVFVTSLLYLPYYLLKTRRMAGAAWLLLFVVLYMFGTILQLVALSVDM